MSSLAEVVSNDTTANDNHVLKNNYDIESTDFFVYKLIGVFLNKVRFHYI